MTRLLLERELEADDLLVVTFTIAATEELDSRIRAHITDVLTRWPRREELEGREKTEDAEGAEEKRRRARASADSLHDAVTRNARAGPPPTHTEPRCDDGGRDPEF